MAMTAMEIRHLRKSLGWNQAELAKRLGVNIMTISRWETDQRKISRRMLKSLLQIKAIEDAKKNLLPST
jgi:transcriptional regulator with XRE-family HTH domain